MPLHCLVATTRAVPVIDRALRKKRGTLRALHLLWCPAHVVFDTPRPRSFVVAVLVAILRSAVAVIKHALALGAAFHCSLPLFTAHVFGCAFHAAMPMCWTARCERLPAPSAGLWKVDPILFTGHGYLSSLQLVFPRRRHSPN